ncbi:MAG: uroporphyrinogen III synthase [Arcobacter sp.]|nr:MAG: uroporphyrinogen III synthase [Arcobacter sp.]
MNKIYLLSNHKYDDIENLEVFKIEYIPSMVDLSLYDALIITSKNAIYSLNSFNNDWKDIPSFAIAKKTAEVIKKEGGVVEFTGKTGHGNDFAKELIPLLRNKKVLYVRALKVASNLVNLLKDYNIDVEELITYKTVCNKSLNAKIENYSTIIFTSPSSINCFFNKYSWNDTLKAIVIGKTTGKYMPDDIKYEISSETSLEECIKLAKRLTL